MMLRAGVAGSGGAAPVRPGLRATVASLNHNVLLTAVAKALSGVASGIWAMSTIATYLFMIEDNSNTVLALVLHTCRRGCGNLPSSPVRFSILSKGV